MQKNLIASLSVLLLTSLLASTLFILPHVRAQDGCGTAPSPRLWVGGSGQVMFTDGQPLNVREQPTTSGRHLNQIEEGGSFHVIEGPVCADNIYWWNVSFRGGFTGWIAEGSEGSYFVEPVMGFTAWEWDDFVASGNPYWREGIPDPMTITPPGTYRGNLPALPVDLSSVLFLEDAGLNETQLALLAQNGFVVVPARLEQFHDAYTEDEIWATIPEDFDWEAWDADPTQQQIGHGFFVTSDAVLHELHFIFDNLLTDIEKWSFYNTLGVGVLTPALQAAQTQTREAAGTPLETPARNAELYLSVAVKLLWPSGDPATFTPDLLPDINAITDLALAGEGQLEIPFLPGYVEDFSQYRPRGHYAGDEILESYFRAMMWLSRISFLSDNDAATQTALLLLRALRADPATYQSWRKIHDTLTFLIGPIDDLGPLEYAPLADSIFGSDLQALADTGKLATFREQVNQLPGPRINGLIVSNDTMSEDLPEITRGFRFMGQRFTFDGYVMQQLMWSYVGTADNKRLMPLSLDVAAAMGSDTAYTLAGEAGATGFANYDSQITKLRGELDALTTPNWLENVYGTWLWALKPLWTRDNPAAYPPMMLTEAWLRRDLHTGLASWTELKHDTVLYAKQPTGFGGGGPPLTTFGYVEPNPLVFARIAIVAAQTYKGLMDHSVEVEIRGTEPGMYVSAHALLSPYHQEGSESLMTTLQALRTLAFESAFYADTARRELAGEPMTEEDYWAILGFGSRLRELMYTLNPGDSDPDPVALVTDVASNPSIGAVLQEGVGGVDYIYVVIPNPRGGWQLVRGGSFSYYEFTGDINQRMTDDEWREMVFNGQAPPRPSWVSAFYAE